MPERDIVKKEEKILKEVKLIHPFLKIYKI